jgi:tetratricopeptide (TPR) repeat protein
MRFSVMRVLYLSLGLAVAVGAGGYFWLAHPGESPAPPAELRPLSAPTPAPGPAVLPPAIVMPPPPAPAATAEPSTPEAREARHRACLTLAGTDSAAALRHAEAAIAAAPRGHDPRALDWAEHCAAAALLAMGALEQAADRLERQGMGDGRPAADRASLLAQAGQVWLMAGDAERAFAAATLALVITPDDVELLTDRAVAAASLGRNFEAIDDLNRVIDLDPARAEAFVYRAGAWRQAGRAELAADDIARALAIDPGNAEAYLERGLLRAAAGRPADARADWQRAAERAPGSPTEELARRQIEALDRAPPLPAPAPAPERPRGR